MKERGLIEFLPGTLVFVLSIVDVLSLAAAPLLLLMQPLSINTYIIFIQLIAQVYPVSLRELG